MKLTRRTLTPAQVAAGLVVTRRVVLQGERFHGVIPKPVLDWDVTQNGKLVGSSATLNEALLLADEVVPPPADPTRRTCSVCDGGGFTFRGGKRRTCECAGRGWIAVRAAKGEVEFPLGKAGDGPINRARTGVPVDPARIVKVKPNGTGDWIVTVNGVTVLHFSFGRHASKYGPQTFASYRLPGTARSGPDSGVRQSNAVYFDDMKRDMLQIVSRASTWADYFPGVPFPGTARGPANMSRVLDRSKPPRSLAAMNEILRAEIDPSIELIKGDGYFYGTLGKYGTLPSIPVYALNRMSIAEWKREVESGVADLLREYGVTSIAEYDARFG